MSDALAGTRSPHFALDATVQTYASIHVPRVFAPWARVLLEAVPAQPGDTVLDVATGPGTVARQAALLVGQGSRVCGVDISPAMLCVGRAWPPEPGAAPIEYVEASAAFMPLPDDAFDVVYCQQGLQHMTDPLAALREIRRVLKPGGRLGVALWKQSPFGLFREVVTQMGLAGEGMQPSMFGRDVAELECVLGEEGFEDVSVQTRELVAVLDGDIPQALQVAEATTAGLTLSGLSESGQRSLREAFMRALQPYVRGESVHLPSVSTSHPRAARAYSVLRGSGRTYEVAPGSETLHLFVCAHDVQRIGFDLRHIAVHVHVSAWSDGAGDERGVVAIQSARVPRSRTASNSVRSGYRAAADPCQRSTMRAAIYSTGTGRSWRDHLVDQHVRRRRPYLPTCQDISAGSRRRPSDRQRVTPGTVGRYLPGAQPHLERLRARRMGVDCPFDPAAGRVERDALRHEHAAASLQLELFALTQRCRACGHLLAGECELDPILRTHDRVQAAFFELRSIRGWRALQVEIVRVKDHRSSSDRAQPLDEDQRRADMDVQVMRDSLGGGAFGQPHYTGDRRCALRNELIVQAGQSRRAGDRVRRPERANAPSLVQYGALFEVAERLADGGPADAQCLCKLVLGWQRRR